jgi:aminoglycoside phosphotransferase family enzyme
MSTAEAAAASVRYDSWLPAIKASAGLPIEVIETPLSWVFLTDRHAYKIKKSVDLGEARYRSPASRRQACLDEIWLNRRLAAGVYLGVVPLARESGGQLRLGGKGAAVEWAVKMRRLRSDCSMFWLMDHGKLTSDQVSTLANALADFYFASPPESNVLDDLCTRLRRRVDDDKPFDARWPASVRQAVREIRSAQREYLDKSRMVLNLRVCDGRVVDGHGDLRPEHVFLERQPAIIDCLEYSPARRKSDALDDLCALTMECQRLGRSDVAEAVVSAYRRRTGDECFYHLEAFYRSLHACTRAQAADVSGARPDVSRLDEAATYLEQAARDCKVFS